MLVGPFFGVVVYAAPRPYVSTAQLEAAGVVGGLLGGLLGVLVGALQLSRLRRRFAQCLSLSHLTGGWRRREPRTNLGAAYAGFACAGLESTSMHKMSETSPRCSGI